MTVPRASWKAYLVAGLLVLVAGSATAYWLYAHRRDSATEPPTEGAPSFPVLSLSSSPFLNARLDVDYVGSAACLRCHDDEHAAGFHRTGMGRSMAPVDLAREPPDASFDHPVSKRRYQVVRKDGKMYHRELLLTDDPAEVLLSEFPVKYVVGSGRHSLTYVVEVDGFLVESPVTWYTSKKAWGMSPGYDRPNQQGFERATGESCLTCHAGMVEAVGGSLHRMKVAEPAISCERCHGPGALHVEHHKVKRDVAGIDYTIVNPAHLSRDLAEAVCSQCHLRSNSTILSRGRSFADFRPGLPLQDFRQDYCFEKSDGGMSVVGHVEQTYLSRCYQRSKTFTCLTCHDPHNEPSAADREAHYRAACLTCHQTQQCKVDPAVRRARSPSNDCVRCHMPTSPTEIPHLAFTHHRVGIHDLDAVAKEKPGVPTTFTPLTALLDLSRLSEVDRRRSLGLAYLEVANLMGDSPLSSRYRARAIEMLRAVRAEGLRDGAVDAALARAQFDVGGEDAAELARSALASERLDPQDRCNATFLLAEGLAHEGKRAEAIPLLRELATLRRQSVPLLLLADCEKAVGDPAYVETLEKAVSINPRLWKVHQFLAKHYRGKGDEAKAAYHRKRAVE